MEGKLLWKRAEIASDYSDLNQGLYKQPGMLSEPAVQVRVHPQSDLSTAKIQQNSETTKLSSKKELPPVLPLGTNRRGISQGSSWCCTPVWLVFNGRTGMLGTAPSGSVQLQDYCVRPEKIGEPYFCYYRLLPQVARTYLCTRNLSDSPKERAVFKSLSDSSSDPRRRAEAPVVTYSALSSSKELSSTHY